MVKFDENHPELKAIKQLFDWELSSVCQKYIVFLKIVEKLNQREIIYVLKQHGLYVSFKALNHCLFRSYISPFWEPGMIGGSDLYLCPKDIRKPRN